MMISTATAASQKNGPIGSRAKQHLWSLFPLLAMYLLLALYDIDRQSLWGDEYKSLWRVTAAPYPIWKDGHGFLYFALLHLWTQVGTSELILRSLSVLLGAVAVCLTYAFSSALFDRRGTVIGTTLFATSPVLISYSQEVRYITLAVATTLLAMYAFRRLISQPGLRWWLVYGSATLLAFFSFLSTLLLPVAQGLYLLGSPSRRPFLKKWVVCQMVVFALFIWWFVNGTHFWKAFVEAAGDSQQSFINNPNLFPFSGFFNQVRSGVVPYTFFVLSTGFSLGPSLRDLYADRSLAPLVAHAPMLFSLAVLYGVLLLSGLMALRRQEGYGLFLALWVAIPVISVFSIAKLLNLFYDVRYVAWVLPAYVLLLTAGIVSFRRTAVQMTLLGAVLTVHSLALANYYFDPRYAREDTRSAGQYLESAAKPGDIVLLVGIASSLPHYYKGNLPLVYFGSPDAAGRHYTGNLPLVYFGNPDAAGRSLTERLRKLGENHDRLWLVKIRPWLTDPKDQAKVALDDVYALVEQQHFPGVDIYAYQISK
jgi:4-amino-4-deoxy-L-arabinose transferase-like glycosyltransferase